MAKVLDEGGWIKEQEAACQNFLGISREEFTERFLAGEYDGDKYCDIAHVAAFFPELD